MVMMHVRTVHTLLMATWQRANCTDVCGYLFCIDVSKLTVALTGFPGVWDSKLWRQSIYSIFGEN